MDYTPTILKNVGISCQFSKTKADANGWSRVLDEKAEIAKETLMIRFNNNSISEIEEFWGGLEPWQDALEKKPYTTIRQTLSFVLQREIIDIGEAMLEGEIVAYANVIGSAWSIANGVDPDVASQMLTQAFRLAEENKKALQKNLEEMMPLLGMPQTESDNGNSGLVSGPKRASRSKNSGNSAQRKQP